MPALFITDGRLYNVSGLSTKNLGITGPVNAVVVYYTSPAIYLNNFVAICCSLKVFWPLFYYILYVNEQKIKFNFVEKIHKII